MLIPAVLMVGTVGTMFMEVGRGPEIVRLFAVAALLWLTILLGLGSLDPMTRTDYHRAKHIFEISCDQVRRLRIA